MASPRQRRRCIESSRNDVRVDGSRCSESVGARGCILRGVKHTAFAFPALAIALSLSATLPARAEGRGAMADAMRAYLEGEKAQGSWWTGVGLMGVGASVAALTQRTSFARGMAYPLGIVGIIQMAYGIGAIARADGVIAKNHQAIAEDAAGFQKTELARIRRSGTGYLIIEIVEGVLIAGGTVLAIVGASTDSDSLKGVGVGLAIQGAAMLTLDGVAHARASRYQNALERFRVAALPSANGRPGAFVSYDARF